MGTSAKKSRQVNERRKQIERKECKRSKEKKEEAELTSFQKPSTETLLDDNE